MAPDLRPGLSGSADLVVGEEHTAPSIGSGKVRVLATPVMINLIEAGGLAAVEQSPPEHHQSLGTRLDITHVAATPVGMKATEHCLRCALTTRPQAGLPMDAGILHTAQQRNENRVGIYADISNAGTVRIGDGAALFQ